VTAVETPASNFKVKGAAANINTDQFAVWANVPISVPGSHQTTVNHWELAKGKQPVGMTPEGNLLWEVLRQLLYSNEVLGVTYRGGIEPRHVILRITPGTSTTPPGIPPEARDIEGEELLASRFGEKYRLLEGLDVVADSLRTMTGMPKAPPLAPKHDNYVVFDRRKNEFEWTSNGEVVVRAVVHDIVTGFNRALNALRGDTA
jgi:hypothetical protein